MKKTIHILLLGAILATNASAASAPDEPSIDCPSLSLPAGKYTGRFTELKFNDRWQVANILFMDDATNTGYCLSINPNYAPNAARYAAIVNAYMLNRKVAIETDVNQGFTAFAVAQD